MRVPKSAAEVEDAAKEGRLTETATFDAKAALPGPKKNSTLAVDVAAMTTAGGLLLYGVAEDEQGEPTRPTPIELAGVEERVDQIISNSITEIPHVDSKTIPLEGDPARGYMALAIPPSERAPHQVIVGGEYRFYGRGAKGNRLLGEAEIAALYRRRERWDQDGRAILAEVVASAGVPHRDPGHGILHAFARPVASDPDLFERALPALSGQAGVHQKLLTAVQDTKLRDSYGPNVERAPFWEHGSADEWRLATRSSEERLNDLTDLVEVRINRDGRGQLLCGRASDARLTGDGGEMILEAVIAGNLEAFLKIMGTIYEAADYLGQADVGVAITDVAGAGSLYRSENWGTGSFTHDGDGFSRVARVPASMILAPPTLAHELLRSFYEATTGVEGYNPFLASDQQALGGRWTPSNCRRTERKSFAERRQERFDTGTSDEPKMAKKRKRSRQTPDRRTEREPKPLRGEADFERARREGKAIALPDVSALHKDEVETAHDRYIDLTRKRRAEFIQTKRRLLELLAPHDGFDLLAALQIASAQVRPKSTDPIVLGTVVPQEVMAMLLAERGSLDATAGGGAEATFVEALRLHTAFSDLVITLWPDVLAPPPSPLETDPDARLNEIRNRMASAYVFQPIVERDDQTGRTAARLFDDPVIHAHLTSNLGLDANDALSLTDAMGELTVRGFDAAAEAGRGTGGWRGNGRFLSFSVQELAATADVEEEQAGRFVERFSMPIDGTAFAIGDLTTSARIQPLLRHGDRVMPTSIPTLRRMIRRSLAALLNPAIRTAGSGDKKAFAIFTARRGAQLEQRAATMLERFLRPDWIETNAYFKLPSGQRGEIDVLARIEDTLLVVQAKSGATRVDTEIGDKEKFGKTLVELLGGEDLRQHRDGRQAIEAGVPFTHDQAGHRRFEHDLGGVVRALPLHVTLEDLSVVGAQPWLLVDAGLSSDAELPWIVGADQMEMLLDYFELPAVFLHFLTRRLKANRTRRLLATDEVDWAVRYGQDELLWAELPPDHPLLQQQIVVLEEHQDFDRWQLARQTGERAKRPRPRLSGGAHKLLSELDQSRPSGWLAFSLAFLDLNRKQRPQVVKRWERVQKGHVSNVGASLDVSFHRNGSQYGFSVLRETPGAGPEMANLVQGLCDEKLACSEASQWWALVSPVEPPGRIKWCCGRELNASGVTLTAR
jgi:hypothetical protein